MCFAALMFSFHFQDTHIQLFFSTFPATGLRYALVFVVPLVSQFLDLLSYVCSSNIMFMSQN